MVDSLIETICEEADDFEIKLVVEDRKGAIFLRRKEIRINPEYYDERAETFTHEMLHHYYKKIACYDLSRNEEAIIEMNALIFMKNQNNKRYVLDYLSRRGL